MRKSAIIILLLALALPSVCDAQRRKAAKKPAKVEVVEENPLAAQMLAATQQVVFIDSLVVGKNDYFSHIPLSPECGRIVQNGSAGQYTTELGDRRIEALRQKGDTAAHLAVSDLIGGQWTEPAVAKGIGSGDARNPYLMPDGTTLYFAQKGEKSLGGHDIFVTRYNAANGAFLRPENIGMPFASEANDLLYVVDEPMQLGYFVSDRRQPEGKVCIYVFIPSTSRRVYQSEAYSPEKLRSLAAINRIADTWGDGKERKKALERLAKARQAFGSKNSEGGHEGQSLTELDKMRKEADRQKKALAEARKDYAKATAEEKEKMKNSILDSEQTLEQLLLKIRKKEKERK